MCVCQVPVCPADIKNGVSKWPETYHDVGNDELEFWLYIFENST